jgi:hypothetical protein
LINRHQIYYIAGNEAYNDEDNDANQ